MGIKSPALTRLETGKMLNPTLATLHKRGETLGRKLDVDLSSGCLQKHILYDSNSSTVIPSRGGCPCFRGHSQAGSFPFPLIAAAKACLPQANELHYGTSRFSTASHAFAASHNFGKKFEGRFRAAKAWHPAFAAGSLDFQEQIDVRPNRTTLSKNVNTPDQSEQKKKEDQATTAES